MSRAVRSGVVTIAAVALLLVAACDSEDGRGITGRSTTVASENGGDAADTTQPPETTAPPTTEAPPSTEAPSDSGGTDTTVTEEDTGSNAAIWAIVLGVVVILGIILWIIGRGSNDANTRQDAAAAVPAPEWKSSIRSSYAESLWLHDNMTEGLAVWRGNATFDGTDAEGATAGTGQAHTWSQLDPRMTRATDSLYAVEAAPPDAHTAEVCRGVVTGLTDVRSALDARADARYEYRKAEAGADQPDDPAITAARDREQRSAQNLEAARSQLLSSLTSLSALV